jgi:hypothetical protein
MMTDEDAAGMIQMKCWLKIMINDYIQFSYKQYMYITIITTSTSIITLEKQSNVNKFLLLLVLLLLLLVLLLASFLLGVCPPIIAMLPISLCSSNRNHGASTHCLDPRKTYIQWLSLMPCPLLSYFFSSFYPPPLFLNAP